MPNMFTVNDLYNFIEIIYYKTHLEVYHLIINRLGN